MKSFREIRIIGLAAGVFLSLLFAGGVFGCTYGKVAVDVGSASYVGCKEDAVDVYKGIRYATARRWEPPTLTEPSGEVTAFEYGLMCAQGPYVENEMTEDCLFLNIWTPSDAEDLPVMLYIHGGSFLYGSGGSASDSSYDGETLARDHDIVVVTINYRLGVFGFYHQGDEQTGNFGVLDQTTALQWVQNNIHAFGGDPEKVTIVGESAGSMSVGVQLAMAESRDLFRGAVLESPYYGLYFKSSSEAGLVSETVDNLRSTLCAGQPCTAEELVGVQYLTMAEYSSGGLESLYTFTPYIDGILLNRQPIFATTDKPVILGENQQESLMFTTPYRTLDLATYETLLTGIFGHEAAGKLLAMDRYNTPYTNSDSQTTYYHALNNVINDGFFICGANYALDAQDTGGAFGYAFDYVTSFPPLSFRTSVECAYAPCHSDELYFVFDNSANVQNFGPADWKMADEMGAYWAGFIKSGAPGSIDGVPWEPYKGNGRYILTPGSRDYYTRDPNSNCAFWTDEVYEKNGTRGLIERFKKPAAK